MKNIDGYLIEDEDKWEYWAERPKEYKRKKIGGLLWLAIPICGFLVTEIIFNEMGLSWVMR